MIKNYLKHFKPGLKSQIFAALAIILSFSAGAQTIDVNPAEPDRPDPLVTYFTGTTDEITFTTTGAFETGTTFYLHTGSLDEENVLAQSAAAATLAYTWPQSQFGSESFSITAATGSFDAETIEIDQNMVSVVGGTIDNFGDFIGSQDYDMTGTGVRRVTTQAINVDFSDEVTLNIGIYDGFVVSDRPLRVQFSTDGVNFTNMTDVNADDEWFGTGARNLQFVLTSGQKTAGTIFRVVQEGSNSLTSGVERWYLNEDISVEVGGIVEELSTFISNYTIQAPSTSITAFNDESGNPVFNYFAGQTVEITGGFNGGTDQEDDFSYTAVFENGNDRFQLQSVTDATVGTDITVEGTIPTTVDFNTNWDVSIQAYNGASPILGLDEEFSSVNGNLDELDAEGGSLGGLWEFAADEDRSLTTPSFNIESNDNSSVSFDLSKISAGLAPAGTEIVLEFSTGGSFTQIGDAVSLNDDLSESVVFEDLPAGVVSTSTQFRIRQLSNNGAGLSTWSVNNIQINSGGNIITNGDIEYFQSNIDIDQPTIALDPANVPDDLIFPGTELELTYNITNGALTSGSILTAVLDNTSFEYVVGTSTAITPGSSEDHTITITIPPLVGGNYSVSLISNEGVESNQITVPVYNTTVEIVDIASNSGVTDGGEDVIFPGSEITVTYTIDGQIGTGSELMLEVRDYDQDEQENDGFVLISSTTTINGTVTGTLPSNINFDDNGGDTPLVRVKIGNGLLATTSSEFVRDLDGNSISNASYSEEVFNFDLTQGNNPQDEDVFIGAGARSATTFAADFSLGGSVSLLLTNTGSSYNGTPQNVYLQASTDGGANWLVIADEEYAGGNISFSEDIPAELRGTETLIRFIYNMDGEAAEFENQLRLNFITLIKSSTVQANSDTESFGGQFRRPTVSLEQLDDYNFFVGEELTIEYTTSGNFPANTAFAIVLEGSDIETVIGESDAQGLASVDVTMPAFAREDNGSGPFLYNEIKVVAFDKVTPTTTYTPDETIIIDEDEQFLVIEGTDNSNGFYLMDEAGDRSLLTQAFDLSGADRVFVNFSFTDFGIEATSNRATIPVLQVSIDAGATFQNIPAEEDGILGDGFLFTNNFYSGEVPSELITDATHFRWYQPLNLGAGQNNWRVQNISLTLEKGNEITTYYTTENSPVGASLSHPNISDFEWEQADEDTDPVFNGETFTFDWTKTFESTPAFPEGTQFEFILSDGSDIIDPLTNRPYVIGTADALGSFEANIPFFVEEGNYDVKLIAKIADEENGDYFYFGDDDGTSSTIVGDLDVFLRAVKTTLQGDPNAVVYAGSTVTFSIDIENDDDNLTNTDDLFANLIAVYDSEDWILATQTGTADITVDLPPFIRGFVNFRVELSEGGPLGEVGETLDNNDLLDLQDDLDNFINESQYTFVNSNGTNDPNDDFFLNDRIQFQSIIGRRLLTTRTFEVGELENATLIEFDIYFDKLPEALTADQFVNFEYSIDGGTTYTVIETFPEDDADEILNFENVVFQVTDDMRNNPVRFRWRQQENNGLLILNNINIIAGERLPFDNISAGKSITNQAIIVTGISEDETCIENTFNIDYEIRGRFGADNLIEIRYQNREATTVTSSTLQPYEFEGITEGTGTLSGIKFPGNFLSEGDNNAEVYFQLEADDDTNDDYNLFIRGSFSEESIEVVAPVDLDAQFTLTGQRACDLDDVTATISNTQNYFTYTLRNAADGTELGTLTYDPEEGENTIDLGELT
ncbi:MAG: hypothetical protein WBA74_16690, partial [Cyclobacteriaceae bacterium]